MKVSFTIAVYNTEKYIPECVDSLLRQTHEDWEAVFVDDGSADGSVALLEEYARNDARIKVIKMPYNGGQAKARNEGLKYCTGDVISFLDSDDWLSDDALASMVKMFEDNTDTGCVLYDCILKYSDHEKPITEEYFDVLSGEKAALKAITWDNIHGYYAVRSNIHKKYPYDDSVKWYSDDNTTFMHFLASKEVRYCTGKYFYRMREGSVTHNVNIHNFDFLEAKESMRRILVKMNATNEMSLALENSRWLALVDRYMYYYVNKKAFSDDERKDIISRMKRYWENTDEAQLSPSVKLKFGYKVCSSWENFVRQENIYFGIKRLLHRL